MDPANEVILSTPHGTDLLVSVRRLTEACSNDGRLSFWARDELLREEHQLRSQSRALDVHDEG